MRARTTQQRRRRCDVPAEVPIVAGRALLVVESRSESEQVEHNSEVWSWAASREDTLHASATENSGFRRDVLDEVPSLRAVHGCSWAARERASTPKFGARRRAVAAPCECEGKKSSQRDVFDEVSIVAGHGCLLVRDESKRDRETEF